MKIYKLDIDTSKPIRKVSRMQQNSDGVLSVNISNDGKYIRNLSCSVYADGAEVSTVAEGGYKFAVGESPKTVNVVANSTPIESIYQYIASTSGSPRVKNVSLIRLVLPAGTYNQDEFYGIADRFGDKNGKYTIFQVHLDSLSSANFQYIILQPWNTEKPLMFKDASNNFLLPDEPIVATAELSVCYNYQTRIGNYTLSTDTYPAVGYWTDYSLEHVITPSENAPCYAEQEVNDPEPEPEPTPDPDPEP